MDIRETDSEYVAATYSRFPLTVTGGHGSVLVGDDGREYIDLGTGIAVNTFGMCDGEWVEAVKKQLDTCGHTSNLYYTEPCAVLAKMLCERTGMKKVFFSNSGAEANECAIKAARRFAFSKYGDESRSTVITLKNSFHGRTVTTLAATGQDAFHTEFGPFTGGFVYARSRRPRRTRSTLQTGLLRRDVRMRSGRGRSQRARRGFRIRHLRAVRKVRHAHDRPTRYSAATDGAVSSMLI